MRLGQTKRAQHVPLRQRREPLFLLDLVAIAHEDGVDRTVGHADGGAGAAVTCGNFFQHHRQAQVVQASATQIFGHANAVGTECRQPLVHVRWKVVFFVPARRMRPEFLLGKVAHRVADHFLVRIEQHRSSC